MPRKEPRPYHVSIVRYQTSDGRRCSKSTPGAQKVKTRSESYYGRVPNDTGKPVPVALGTTDYTEACVRLRAKLKEAYRKAAGISDQFTDHAMRPWADHVDTWLAVVKAGGTSAKQVVILRSRVEALRKLAGWQRITDVTASTCLIALGRLQSEKGLAAETRNHYLAHVQQFCRWLTADGRLHRNPIADLPAINVETDRRHDRRCPTDEEMTRLLDYLHSARAKTRKGMSGPQRALGYKVSMATGFRADELRSLAERSFDLEAGTVTVTAAYSKHRRNDTQQLPAWLIDQLKAHFAAGGGTWAAFPEYHPGRLLKADLEACGIPYSVPGKAGEPLFFDFHALRVWYISQLAHTPGISPKVLMDLARHSDPRLTLAVYAKTDQLQTQRAVQQLPEPGKKPPGPPEMKSNH